MTPTKYFYVYCEAGWAFHLGDGDSGLRVVQNGFPSPLAAIEAAAPFLELCKMTGPGELCYGGFIGRFRDGLWIAAPPNGTRCLPQTTPNINDLPGMIQRELKRVQRLERPKKPSRVTGAHEEESE